jgi:hypothetical protein
MTVSCSNQRLASGTGWQLVTGDLAISSTLDVAKTPHPGINWLLVAALVVLVAGLVVACLSMVRARTTIATSIGALILIVAGISRYSEEAITRAAEAHRKGGLFDIGSAFAGTIRVDWQWGFWVTLIALGLAAFASWAAWSERARTPPGNP